MFRRIVLARVDHPANANIRQRYRIEEAAWAAHPDFSDEESFLATFQRRFRLERSATITLHVTADQRYHLRLDGELISRGPDRCDAAHWAFATLQGELDAGEHVIEADVLWLAEHRPYAQVAVEPGIQLAAELPEGLEPIDTGHPGWRVRGCRLKDLRAPLPHTFHVCGPGFNLDAEDLLRPPRWCEPRLTKRRWWGNGTVQPGRRLDPSPLPEQLWKPRPLGRVRALRQTVEPARPWRESEHTVPAAWQALAEGTAPLTVPPHRSLEVLFDLDDYVCGYPHLEATGTGAAIEWLWDESLYLELPPGSGAKGNRDVIEGKYFRGFGDRFILAEERDGALAPPWWRAGRYLLWRVTTGASELRIHRAWIAETRYPINVEAAIELPGERLARSLPVLSRGLETGAHETFVDSPFYEQMMYAGDTRLTALCLYSRIRDDRLQRRALELFDWSRHVNGWPAGRYPSLPHQIIGPFGLIWVLMVRDYAWWREDPPSVRATMPAVRDVLERWLDLRQGNGLAVAPPGWSYMDVAEGWIRGIPPGCDADGSASINLLLVLALEAAAELETHFGERLLATRWTAAAEDIFSALGVTHRDPASGALRESIAPETWSEHAAALTLLTHAAAAGERAAALRLLLNPPPGTARANVYFQFYVHAALLAARRGDLFLQRLEFWRSLRENGFRTPPEYQEDNSRSDCHAWTSHVLHHLHSGTAGIRPAAPGFRRVRVDPQPGSLPWLRASVVHPRGEIRLDLTFGSDGAVEGEILLPPGTPGEWHWRGTVRSLLPGANPIHEPPSRRPA